MGTGMCPSPSQAMTGTQLKNFLIGHGLGIEGVTQAQLSGVADVAAEAGFAAVWGRYNWTIRRGTATLSTVANQAYTSLPSDFESLISLVYAAGTRDYRINIKSEAEFDTDFPDPSIQTGVPEVAKVVYQGPNAADRFRLYWFPTPAAVYALPLAYARRSDLAFLPDLPPWLVNAVVLKSLVLMQPTADKRYQADAAAEAAIFAAIASDNPSNTNDPGFGTDAGWDDFAIGGGGDQTLN